MAYYTGIAQSANELLAVLRSACTANGWMLNGETGVLSKGTCYVKPHINGITVALQGAADSEFTIKSNISSHAGLGQELTYPLTYHIHVVNLEVYFFINFNVEFYSFLAFGQSPLGDIPGTGNWISGSGRGGSKQFEQAGSDGNSITHMMFNLHGYNFGSASFFHHGLNSMQWSTAGFNMKADAVSSCFPLLRAQPNEWNGESVLIPIRPLINYEGDRRVLVGQLKYGFYVRIDNYAPGQVITIGDAKYKIYPWSCKNLNDRIAYYSGTHSGTFGIAVLHDGD